MFENNLISEKVKLVTGLAPAANVFAGTVYTDIVSLAQYERALFLIEKGVGTTGTATITVEACSDNSGTGATAIAFKYRRNTAAGSPIDVLGAVTAASTSGFTTTAASNDMYTVEVQSSDLPDGKPWVRLKSVEVVASAVAGAVYILLDNGRYVGAELPTVV
jgi:hypothetical protein